MEKELVVENKFEKIRLDVFLVKKNPDTPRSFFQNEIKFGHILVNSRNVRPGHKLRTDDKVEIAKAFTPFEKKEVIMTTQKNIKFKIVFENEDFVIIDKPAGISVHPSQNEPSQTLANGLLEKYPQIKNVGDDPIRPGIVHRLDKETSGLLVATLNKESFEIFKKMFKKHQIQKTYIALCWGHLKQKEGSIKSFIGRSRSNSLRQSTSANRNNLSNPKEAITFFEVVKEMKDTSLVKLKPKTGRMHQLRVHLHSIGHPIVGDKKYATKLVKTKNSTFDRHLLHAAWLSFAFKNKDYNFKSDLPKQFVQLEDQKSTS
ncbi:MAG: RluA family pseudouridine synthase [Patescibacteria group bacterium]|nr:RluA family pseudouridine synthase [Patescibacteria group bacterium]